MAEETRIKTFEYRLSPRQWPVMKAIEGGVKWTLDDLRSIDNGPLRSLHRRGFIRLSKAGNLVLTEAGAQAYWLYKNGRVPTRSHSYDLTDYVAAMLRLRGKK